MVCTIAEVLWVNVDLLMFGPAEEPYLKIPLSKYEEKLDVLDSQGKQIQQIVNNKNREINKY